MTSTASIHLRAGALLAFALCAAASAQTVFPEVEPNSSVNDATVVNCMAPGDSLTGTTTGATYGVGNPAATTIDFFNLKTCALPQGIYRHKLTLTTAIFGQTAGSEVANQINSTGCGSQAAASGNQYGLNLLTNNEVHWDAFGKGEQQYFQIRGVPGTTAPYTMTLATPTTITPTVIGPFAGGSITITTAGQGHTTDTSLIVYDSTLTLIATYLNEDECPPASATDYQSTLTRNFSAGTYYLAVGTWPTVVGTIAPIDDNGPFNFEYLAQFPDALFSANNGALSVGNVSFAVTDQNGTTPVAVTKNFFYETQWFTFVVNTPAPGTLICVPGTGIIIPCACGNPNGAGLGCANTGSAGASISSAGTASVAGGAVDPGSITLTGTDMKSGSSCIFLQGDLPAGAGGVGVTFGAGIRCAGGQLFRLYNKTGLAVAGGVMTAPTGADVSIINRAAALGTPILSGSTRFYQIYYRDPGQANPGGSCPANDTFNITPGQQVVWGP